jgi:hypothetical protein
MSRSDLINHSLRLNDKLLLEGFFDGSTVFWVHACHSTSLHNLSTAISRFQMFKITDSFRQL